MDANREQKQLWSSAQAYVLAIVCLLLGIVTGYLLHPPKRVNASVSPAPAATGGMPGAMPTPEQLKHMADKAAEPIIANLEKDPNNADLLSQAASTYFRGHQFSAAAEYYERAVKIAPTADRFVSLSNAYHYGGSDDRAFEMLKRALELDPKSPDALFNLGMLDWQVKGDPKAAVDAWQKLLKSNPNHPRRAQVESMIAKAKQHVGIVQGQKTTKSAM